MRFAPMAAAAAVLAGATLAGCTGEREDSELPLPRLSPGGAAERAESPPVEVRTVVTRVAGDLPDPRRARVARQVDAVVTGYVEGAFLAPGRARLTGFTAGARRSAEHDLEVLTAGPREQLRPGRASAYVAVVAPDGRPVGAAVRLSVEFHVTSPEGAQAHARPVRLQGRLSLTPTPQGWRIFGYRLSRTAAPGEGAAS